ncbi:replicative DNA helicase [Brevundimonas nasdae]|uniref:replicative DNA helicase n=1 Tax=Brevundimonas nasdae TaxID=172043 RepID=UPI00191417BC|nr:replicative DNA helicase [Brevundimonas nasdae]MBK6024519.1 replicative DNA helicase [Brevundimonas nasdae]MDQ0453605.1 replicative DNA helicase [Brevundimonas nasdae]
MIDAGADTSGLPKNLEAEQALLGQIMYDNAVMERLPDALRAEHFFEPYHQRIFEACGGAITAGRTAEPTLLASTLSADPAFSEYGGLRYLADLVDRAPPAANAKDYARDIRDLSDRRTLIRVSGDIAASAGDMAAPAAEHVASAEAALFSLAETGDQSKGIQSFRDAMSGAVDMIEAAYRRDGALSGLSTHLIDLDHKLGGLHPSDLLILAGRPSMGKTALATNIAYRVADAYEAVQDADAPRGLRTVNGGVVLFYSLEMSAEQLAMRIIADVAEVSGDKLRKGEIDANQFRRIKEVQARLAEIPLYIDATGGLPIAKLAARARRQKRKTGLDLIVVDYLQLITTGANAQKNRVQEVSEITGALKALAKDLGVPVLALSQLSRKVEEREDKRPQLSDLRESGSIEQDADAVMFVYREAYYLGRAEPKEGSVEHVAWVDEMGKVQGQAEVIIGKQRHGPIGTVRLSFDDDTTRFGNLAREGQYEARYPYGDA